MAYYERMDEAVRYGPVCRRDIRLYSEQEQQIYKYVLENGFITTAETVEILDIKHRRARADASYFIAYPSSYGMYQTG